jgi:nitrite reductase/ring-hydroxylating ferredoxin subunit
MNFRDPQPVIRTSAGKLPICPASELPPGTRRIVETGDRISIGVFNVDGTFYALRNICPHRKAPLCKGQVTGRVTSDGPGDWQMHGPKDVLRCPWHGWEFDIRTGRSVFNPHKVRVRAYDVTVEHDGSSESACDNGDPTLEQFPVTVESGMVTVILANSAATDAGTSRPANSTSQGDTPLR